MLVFIFRWVKSAKGNNARDQHRLRQIYTHKKRKKQLSGLNAGTNFYLPRRVTVYLWIRCFGGHWNPVCEYVHWSTGAEGRLWDHGQTGATGHHSLKMVASCCLLPCRLLSCMTTTVWIWNRSKQGVMCGPSATSHKLKGMFALSYEVFLMFACLPSCWQI